MTFNSKWNTSFFQEQNISSSKSAGIQWFVHFKQVRWIVLSAYSQNMLCILNQECNNICKYLIPPLVTNTSLVSHMPVNSSICITAAKQNESLIEHISTHSEATLHKTSMPLAPTSALLRFAVV